MKQKQINKVIELWRKAKQESITYNVNGKENGINLSLAKDNFIEKLEKAKYECVGDGAYKLVFSKKSVDFVVKIYHNGSVDDKTDERFKLAKFFGWGESRRHTTLFTRRGFIKWLCFFQKFVESYVFTC